MADHDHEHDTKRANHGASVDTAGPPAGKHTLTSSLNWVPLGRSGRVLHPTGDANADAQIARILELLPRLDERFPDLERQALAMRESVGARDDAVATEIKKSRPAKVDVVDTAAIAMQATAITAAGFQQVLANLRSQLAAMQSELSLAKAAIATLGARREYAEAKRQLDEYSDNVKQASDLIEVFAKDDKIKGLNIAFKALDKRINPMVLQLKKLAAAARVRVEGGEIQIAIEGLARPAQRLPELHAQLAATVRVVEDANRSADKARDLAETAYDQNSNGTFKFAEREGRLQKIDDFEARARPFADDCAVVESAAAAVAERRPAIENAVIVRAATPLGDDAVACADQPRASREGCLTPIGHALENVAGHYREPVDETLETVGTEAQLRAGQRRGFASAVEYARQRVASRRDAADNALVGATDRHLH